MSKLNILCVDDDPITRSLLHATLARHAEANVTAVPSIATALEKLAEGPIPEVIILDQLLTEGSGIQLAKMLRQKRAYDRTCLILHSSIGAGMRKIAAHAGIFQCIDKPMRPQEFSLEVITALARFRSGQSSPLSAFA